MIANLALESLGHAKGEYAALHPLDHVNLSQSTNDVYPTAVRIALYRRLEDLMAAMGELFRAAGYNTAYGGKWHLPKSFDGLTGFTKWPGYDRDQDQSRDDQHSCEQADQ